MTRYGWRVTDIHAPEAGPGALKTTPAPRRKVFAWSLWDWGTQPFNTVITQVISCIQNNYDKQYLG